MTQLLVGLSVEVVEMVGGSSHCLICGKVVDGYRLYCQSRRCFHEYERKIGAFHATKAYREYIFWNNYDLAHITFEHFESIDDQPR